MGTRKGVPANRGAHRLKNKKKLARTGLIYAVLGIAMMAVSVKSSNGYYEPAHVIPIVQSEPSPGPDIQLASLSEQPVSTLKIVARTVRVGARLQGGRSGFL